MGPTLMGVFLGLLLGAIMAQTPTTPYFWPLDLEPRLTSSFAEYRSGRFHAGIDLRTGGIGPAVFAAEDGYVSRVACSPWGYGKAIYVTLQDGNIALYAHLDDYYPELRDYVRSEQHRRRQYIVDLELAPGLFAVTRGQRIAAAGMTGIGAPHLHYELRDSRQRPVNPRLLGLDWPDDIRPQINQVLIAPRAGHGLVAGDYRPQILETTNLGNGQYQTAPIVVQGDVGLGLDVVDPGAGGYRLGIHRMRLLADGEEHFRMQHDLMDYDNHRNGVVAYHPYFLEQGRFLLLWRWPGNVTPSYSISPNSGWLDVGLLESDKIVVQVNDFHDNTATLTIPIQRAPIVGDFASGESSQPGAVTHAVHGNALVVSADFPETESTAPELTITHDGGSEPVMMARVSERAWRYAFRPMRSAVYTLHTRHPRLEASSQEIAAFVRGDAAQAFTLGDVTVEATPESPYGVLFVGVAAHGGGAPSALHPLGDAWRLWPENSPIDTPIILRFPIPAGANNQEHMDMYRRQGSGFSRIATEMSAGELVIQTRNLGIYQAMEDHTPPQVTAALPTEGYRAQTRRPYIRATVGDAGSGIARWQATCAGEWLLVKYDPDHNRIEWERDHDLPRGEQTIEIEIWDGAGNSTRLARQVIIP